MTSAWLSFATWQTVSPSLDVLLALLERGGVTVALLIAIIGFLQGKVVSGSVLAGLKTDYEARLGKQETSWQDRLHALEEDRDRRLEAAHIRAARWEEVAMAALRNNDTAIRGLATSPHQGAP